MQELWVMPEAARLLKMHKAKGVPTMASSFQKAKSRHTSSAKTVRTKPMQRPPRSTGILACVDLKEKKPHSLCVQASLTPRCGRSAAAAVGESLRASGQRIIPNGSVCQVYFRQYWFSAYRSARKTSLGFAQSCAGVDSRRGTRRQVPGQQTDCSEERAHHGVVSDIGGLDLKE